MTKEESKQKKIQVPDEDIFVPPEVECGVWTAQPLSIRGTVRLVRLLAGALAMAAFNVSNIVDDAGELSEDGIIQLLSILDPGLIRQLFSIITGLTEAEVDETFNLNIAFDVLLEFWDKEDLSSLWGKATRLFRNQEFQERSQLG